MTVACVAYVLLSLCCAAKSDEFAASTATCSSPDCVADDDVHTLKLLQTRMKVDSQQVEANDEMVSFLKTRRHCQKMLAQARDSTTKLAQARDEGKGCVHIDLTLMQSETDAIKQMKAKDATIEHLTTSVADWKDRALSGGSTLSFLQTTMKVGSQQVEAQDGMVSFLKTRRHCQKMLAQARDSTTKLAQARDEGKGCVHIPETLLQSETDTIKQMKAKDETIELLTTSVAYWRNRADNKSDGPVVTKVTRHHSKHQHQ